jgi:tetratricopeptide (TPR) repeat protein
MYAHICLAATGRLEEAILEIRRAVELDPQVSFTHAIQGNLFYMNGQYDQSIEACREALELDSNCYWAHKDIGLSLERKGMYVEAIAALQKADAVSGGDSAILGSLGYVYAVSGRKGDARKLLEQLEKRAKRTHVAPIHIAWICAGLGDKDHVFACLNRAYADHCNWLNGVKVDPMFISLRTESRFTALLKKMGLQNWR